MANLYLYLAKNDRKGLKILTVFKNKPTVPAIQIENISLLHLPQGFTDKLQQAVNANSTLYTTWIETANNFEELKTQMYRRGYSNMYYSAPLLPFEYESTFDPALPNINKLSSKTKSMLQRG